MRRGENKYVPMYKLVSAKSNLLKNKHGIGGVKFPLANIFLWIPTANEINEMMTIPRLSLSSLETAARACPPMMQLRTTKLCAESTFKILGSAAA